MGILRCFSAGEWLSDLFQKSIFLCRESELKEAERPVGRWWLDPVGAVSLETNSCLPFSGVSSPSLEE